MGTAGLGILARWPKAGDVKARLGRTLGNERAAELYAAFLWDLLRLHSGRRYRSCAYVDPPDACADFAKVFRCEARPQTPGDTGARVRRAVEDLLTRHDKAVVMASDAPDVFPERVERALDLLRGHDVVFGPSDSGGYYLVAMRRPLPIFDPVVGRTPFVLRHMVDLARARGLRVGLVERADAVDTPLDLALGTTRLMRPDLPATAAAIKTFLAAGLLSLI